MDTFVDSSWYFLRYQDPSNEDEPFETKSIRPVDLYIGGIEHAILHLLYARFLSKCLLGDDFEPFTALCGQGMVHGETHRLASGKYIKPGSHSMEGVAVTFEKMSKSKYNGADPLLMIEKYGSDICRLYVLFKAPVDQVLEWEEQSIIGFVRWRNRLLKLFGEPADNTSDSAIKELNSTLSILTEKLDITQSNIPALNVCIAALMKLSNVAANEGGMAVHELKSFGIMLNPFAPGLAQECFDLLHMDEIAAQQKWPPVDISWLVSHTSQVLVQVNGKLRTQVDIPIPTMKSGPDHIIAAVLASAAVKSLLGAQTIRNSYLAKNGRMLNIVVHDIR